MSAILLTAGARLLADIVQRRRLMIDENGTYLGNCPSFPLDEHRCCISLNIAPSIGGLFFVLLACGCGIGWGLFYTVVEPVLWGVILAWTIEDDEPCLYIGLVVQVLLWLVVVHTTCRRLYRKWTGEDRSSGPQEMSEMSAAQEMSGSPGAGWPGAPDGAAGWPGADGGYYPEGSQPAPLPAPAAGGWPWAPSSTSSTAARRRRQYRPSTAAAGSTCPPSTAAAARTAAIRRSRCRRATRRSRCRRRRCRWRRRSRQAELQLATYRQQVQQQQLADEAAAAQLQLQQAETYRRAAQTYRQQSGGRPKLSDDYARAASTYRQASASRERREQERAAATHRQQAAFAAYEAAVTSRGIREEAAAETYRQVQAQAAAQAQQLAAQSYREPPPPQQYASYGAPPQEAYPPSIAGASEADDELDWPGDVDVMQAQQRL